MACQTKQVFETILVAYDGCPQSQRAKERAFSLAEAMSSKVVNVGQLQSDLELLRNWNAINVADLAKKHA